jgi:hypothetical protein
MPVPPASFRSFPFRIVILSEAKNLLLSSFVLRVLSFRSAAEESASAFASKVGAGFSPHNSNHHQPGL